MATDPRLRLHNPQMLESSSATSTATSCPPMQNNPSSNDTNNPQQSQLLQQAPLQPAPIHTVQSNFGPIATQLTSPILPNDLSFLHATSPMNNGLFPYGTLTSPTIHNQLFELPIIPNIGVLPNTISYNQLTDPINYNQLTNDWQTMMNYNYNLDQFTTSSFDIPPDVKNENNFPSNQAQTTQKKKRGRKRKIKIEEPEIVVNGSFVVHDDEKPKKKRGRKSKNSASKAADDSLQYLLSQNRKVKHEGFVGIQNTFGSVKIDIPPKDMIEYDVFGFACTEKIEDILQPKKRTRYVRGLNDDEKKDRRREQNRNAAARSRARKNAMISKVIQLHQENLALRAHVSSTIREMKMLNEEKEKLQALL